VSRNLLCCCWPRQTNMFFLHQSYIHSFDTDSGLLGENVYYLQICSKRNGLLCPHQNKNICRRQIAGFRYFCVFDRPTRQSRNWRGWVTLSWLLSEAFHIYGKISKYAVSSQNCQFAERNNFRSFLIVLFWPSPYFPTRCAPHLHHLL